MDMDTGTVHDIFKHAIELVSSAGDVSEFSS